MEVTLSQALASTQLYRRLRLWCIIGAFWAVFEYLCSLPTTFEVWKLNRKILSIQRAYAKDREDLEKKKALRDEIAQLEASEYFEVGEVETEIEIIVGSRLYREARSLDVETPALSEKDMWAREEYGDRVWFTPKGRAHVRKLIHDERKRRFEAKSRWIPLLSIVLGFIGTITGLVALTVQKKSAEAAATAAGTARISAELARQQTVALQQAAVRISIPEFVQISPGLQPALQIGLTNEGIAVATQVSFQGMFAWKAEPSHKTIGKPTPVSIQIPAMPQGGKGARGYFITIPELTPDVSKLIRQSTKTRTIEFSGKLAYINGFDQLISEDVCKDFFAREQSDVGFIDCDQYAAKVKWWANHEREQKDQPN